MIFTTLVFYLFTWIFYLKLKKKKFELEISTVPDTANSTVHTSNLKLVKHELNYLEVKFGGSKEVKNTNFWTW